MTYNGYPKREDQTSLIINFNNGWAVSVIFFLKSDVRHFDYDAIWPWVLHVWDRHNNTSIAESNLLWPICEKMLILYLFPGLKRTKLANLLIILKHYYVTCANLDNLPNLYCPLRNIKFPIEGVNIPLPDTSAINLHDLNLSHQHTFQVSVRVN